MKPQKVPGALAGAGVGLLVTAPLVAILYLAWRVLGLPFVPFAAFDQLTRLLPGPVITFAIESMVRVIRALHLGATATVAKTAEQTIAVLLVLAAGCLAGALLFFVVRRWRIGALRAGVVVGALAAVLAFVVTLGYRSAAHPAIGGAWAALAFLAWGAALGWVRAALDRPRAPLGQGAAVEVSRADRRWFLIRLGEASATVTVVGAGLGVLVGRWTTGRTGAPARGAKVVLPNADDPVKPAPGTRPEYTPLERHYRIDITTSPPVIREDSWRLKIGGLVDRPMELTLDDLRRYESMEQYVTLSCISNPVAGDLIGTTLWKGVSFKRLLPDFKVRPDATHLKINAADGFYEFVALADINADERVMLAYEWDGQPLLPEHGFPLRIYIPDRYGMKQPKWIESMEALDHSEAGYWVKRGWDQEARMKATAVIDTIAVDMMIGQATSQTLIPVGGIAHAGARGISKVEVRVDEGEWRKALLRRPLSALTWVVWRYDWPFQKGKHTLTVRCFDGNGTPQITEEAPPHPSGASGLHSKSVML